MFAPAALAGGRNGRVALYPDGDFLHRAPIAIGRAFVPEANAVFGVGHEQRSLTVVGYLRDEGRVASIIRQWFCGVCVGRLTRARPEPGALSVTDRIQSA